MTILDDLKTHLQANGIAENIYFNYLPGTDNCVLLRNYDSTSKDLGKNAKVQIIVKNNDMQQASVKADLIYEILYPINQFKKVIVINGKNMHLNPIQSPFYNEKDENNKHSYVFNVNINYERK